MFITLVISKYLNQRMLNISKELENYCEESHTENLCGYPLHDMSYANELNFLKNILKQNN